MTLSTWIAFLVIPKLPFQRKQDTVAHLYNGIVCSLLKGGGDKITKIQLCFIFYNAIIILLFFHYFCCILHTIKSYFNCWLNIPNHPNTIPNPSSQIHHPKLIDNNNTNSTTTKPATKI